MDPRHIRVQSTRTDWRGQLRPEYREAGQWYQGELLRLGLLTPELGPPRRDVIMFELD